MKRTIRAVAMGLTRGVMALAFIASIVLGLAPQTGAYRPVTVLTSSMQPTIPAGSVLLVTPAPASSVRVGDILTYQSPTEARTVLSHRVVEVVERKPRPVIRTKGDASQAADPWEARLDDPTIWRARVRINGLGYVVSALRRPIVRQACVFAAPGALAILWLIGIWRSPAARPAIVTAQGDG